MWAPWRSAMVRHTARPAPTPSNSGFAVQALEDAEQARSALGVEARAVVLHFPRHPACAALCGHGAHRNAGAGWCWLNLRALPSTCTSKLVQQGRVGLQGGQVGGHAPLRGLCRGQRGPALLPRRPMPPAAVQRRTPHARQGPAAPSSICAMRRADCSMVPTNSLRFLQRRALQHIGGRSPSTSRTSLPVRRDVAQRRTQVVRNHAQNLPCAAAAMSATCCWLAASAARNCSG